VPVFEKFVERMNHDLFLIEPLSYHNAIIFERYGFGYTVGKSEMESINQELEIVSLDPLQRLFVLQAMLEAAHRDLEIDSGDDGTMDGPVGAYAMENAPAIRTTLPIADAIPLRRESIDESIDGVKLFVFRLGMLCIWLNQSEIDEFSSIRPLIPVPMRPAALRFLHHVTKILVEFQPADPLQPTVLEVSAS
jgi:hypothetical protein